MNRLDVTRTHRDLLDALPAKMRRDVALGLCVRVLDLVARNSMLPAQQSLAGGVADAVRELVSEEMRTLLGRMENEQ
jgi:hypothetical protein